MSRTSIIAGAAAYFPINLLMTAKALPAIHDITTDTGNPPQWVALLDARKASKNGADYDPTNAPEQQKAYPEIQSFSSEKPPAMVTIDDRALTFDGTWPAIEMLKAFQPWNKRTRAA